MPTADENLATLQRWVDSYTADVTALQASLFTGDMPDEARLSLIGALNYAIDALDMFPDHYKGLGVADDAMVLRLAAAQAVGKGARDGRLDRLAEEAGAVAEMFPGLVDPLDRLVEGLPARAVRGRTAAKIFKDNDTRIVFTADVGRELEKHRPSRIDAGPLGAAGAVKEMEKMLRAGLKKAGIA